MFFKKLKYAALSAVVVFATCSAALQAQAQSDNMLPPPDSITVSVNSDISPTEETHPPLRLTPDKSRILTLDESIERVVIGNEAHVNILMDTAKRLIIVPRLPGATHFTLLGESGKIIMQRHIIVAAPKEKYIRVRGTCRDADGCAPVKMYYCPGMCHEIAIIGESSGASNGGIASLGGATPANLNTPAGALAGGQQEGE